MSDFISLRCPACGAPFQIKDNVDRFYCASCGTEQLLKKDGGIIYLEPIVSGIKQVKDVIDKTASELAITRLKNEIEVLVNEREIVLHKNIQQLSESQSGSSGCYLKAMIFIGILVGIIIIANANNGFIVLLGVVVMAVVPCFGAVKLGNRSSELQKLQVRLENEKRSELDRLDTEINLKKAELEHHKRNVKF